MRALPETLPAALEGIGCSDTWRIPVGDLLAAGFVPRPVQCSTACSEAGPETAAEVPDQELFSVLAVRDLRHGVDVPEQLGESHLPGDPE